MKKQIIAAAVAAAVAVPAMAQVKVYGRLDAGYQNKKVGAVNSTGVAYSSDTSSRIGFSASEDLGSGLKATVVLEGTVASTDIPGTGTTTPTDVNLTDRAMHVTVSGGFGSIRAGFQNTAGKNIQDAYDAGGGNNIEGKLPDTLEKDGSRVHAITASTNLGPANLYLMAMNRDASGATAGTGYTGGATVKSGPFSADVAYSSITADPFKTVQTSLGGSYDLGMATVMGFYHDIAVDGTAATKVDESGYQIGLKVPLNSTTHVYGQFHKGDSKTGSAGELLDRDGMQGGIKHNLSKRTYVYGIYGQQEVGAAAAAAAKKSTTYAFGLVHSF
jgi:predicted porin